MCSKRSHDGSLVYDAQPDTNGSSPGDGQQANEGDGSSFTWNLRSCDSFDTSCKKPVEHVDTSVYSNDSNDSLETPLKNFQEYGGEPTIVEDGSSETPLKTVENGSSETPSETVENEFIQAHQKEFDMNRMLHEKDEQILALERQVAKLQCHRCPVEQDDRTDQWIDQTKQQDEKIRKLEKEKNRLECEVSDLKTQRKSQESHDSAYLRNKVKELEEKVEDGKKIIAVAEREKMSAINAQKEQKKILSQVQEENTNLTLNLEAAVSTASQHISYQKTYINIIAAQQQELAAVTEEAEESRQSVLHKLRFMEEQKERDEMLIKRVMEKNRQLHQVLRILSPDSDTGSKYCGQCLQSVDLAKPCWYHPLPPLPYTQWKERTQFMELAENPKYESFWYFECCDKLDKCRPMGCQMQEAHAPYFCSLHSPHTSMH